MMKRGYGESEAGGGRSSNEHNHLGSVGKDEDENISDGKYCGNQRRADMDKHGDVIMKDEDENISDGKYCGNQRGTDMDKDGDATMWDKGGHSDEDRTEDGDTLNIDNSQVPTTGNRMKRSSEIIISVVFDVSPYPVDGIKEGSSGNAGNHMGDSMDVDGVKDDNEDEYMSGMEDDGE